MRTLPTVAGVIRRRILVNYRLDPELARRHIPPRFRPKLVDGWGMGGICLIRLEQMRPKSLPSLMDVASENATHRIAVEWDDVDGNVREGVYIHRRDTSSVVSHLAGGRLFPGELHLARFDVDDQGDTVNVLVKSEIATIHVRGHVASSLPETSVFSTPDEASRFFENGSVGYAPRSRDDQLDAVRLDVRHWAASPLAIDEIQSTFFDDPALFPAGAAVLDSAMIMRNIDHEWHVLPA